MRERWVSLDIAQTTIPKRAPQTPKRLYVPCESMCGQPQQNAHTSAAFEAPSCLHIFRCHSVAVHSLSPRYQGLELAARRTV